MPGITFSVTFVDVCLFAVALYFLCMVIKSTVDTFHGKTGVNSFANIVGVGVVTAILSIFLGEGVRGTLVLTILVERIAILQMGQDRLAGD
ncbi:MAG: hypothetical protein A3J55_00600 [Candidatus Ryanbacteria bacterium RIFCSPHIGHO2_02_FULL_45_17b]|uniref:Uncharacterized protein n=1 Tax=Candidatus Ryanbacteria bacterium RIFCSPHIGHO2_01_FULL_45_22 TaxID=1802114 RepID=A0A1G2G1D7_9BACT|nr:MAG: hypothetical protein A2719_03065 [Candidatus Ryanbacteria bacterium RIFCSPHIGHO2_01_FULL_45_22]OGZ47042.1 MAG: hypothetical protein A3J55_00600 [Candidatus Ryanbacteria bacterium RIFCSPHIGHO2_02_FULL_45_17b]